MMQPLRPDPARDALFFFAMVAGIVLLAARVLLGCSGASSTVAGGVYTGQQLECVEHAVTRDEADACRQAVRDRWDGGADASEGGAR